MKLVVYFVIKRIAYEYMMYIQKKIKLRWGESIVATSYHLDLAITEPSSSWSFYLHNNQNFSTKVGASLWFKTGLRTLVLKFFGLKLVSLVLKCPYSYRHFILHLLH